MKPCSFEKFINPYLDGELSGEKLRAFEAHLQACPSCSEAVEQFCGLLGDLREMEDREVPPELEQRLHAALAEEIAKGDRRVKSKFNPWVLTAAAAVVFCLVGGALLASSGGLHASMQRAPNYNSNLASVAKGSVADNYMGGAPEEAPAATAAAMATMAAATMAPEAAAGDSGQSFTADQSTTNGDGQKVAAATDRLTRSATNGLKIIYTANLVIETRKFDDCQNTVKSLLTKYGGYVESSQSNGVPEANAGAQARSAVISMRLPIDNYDKAMADLKAMGNVLSVNESTQDVSRQYVDTEARNKTLIAERDKLYELMAKAETTDSVIALENRIAELTTEIEQQTAQLRFWDDKVSYSTVTVELHELVTPKKVEATDPDLNARVNGALYDTLSSMKKGLENFAVRFVGFLPWLGIILIAIGIVLAVAIPVARHSRRVAAQRQTKKEE